MTKIKREPEETFEIKLEAESDRDSNTSCEIRPAKIPKLEIMNSRIKKESNLSFEEIFDMYFGDIPTGPNQETIVIDSEVSDDEDCILVTFKCDKCPESFNTACSLRKHKKKHDQKFVCRTCNKKFRQESALQDHKRDYHDYPGRFQCLDCGKKFNTKRDLENHDKVQTPKTFKCPFCNAEIKGKGTFRNHKKSHTTVKMEPKIKPKTEFMDVKEEQRICSFGDVKIEMDS